MEATHRAVWEAVKRDLFQPEVLLYAVEKAIAKARDAEPSDAGQQTTLQGQLDAVEQELARLATAIATGGNVPTLLAAIQERESRRTHHARPWLRKRRHSPSKGSTCGCSTENSGERSPGGPRS
jgi:hypothetical protein